MSGRLQRDCGIEALQGKIKLCRQERNALLMSDQNFPPDSTVAGEVGPAVSVVVGVPDLKRNH